jgi:hypothetical protein
MPKGVISINSLDSGKPCGGFLLQCPIKRHITNSEGGRHGQGRCLHAWSPEGMIAVQFLEQLWAVGRNWALLLGCRGPAGGIQVSKSPATLLPPSDDITLF